MKTSTSTLCIACGMIAGLSFAQNGDKPRDGGNRMAEYIAKMDTNKDGKVSKEEFAEFSKKEGEERFAKIDTNGDGVADEAELKAAMERMRGAAGGGERRKEGAPGGEGGFRRPPEGGAPGNKGAPPEGRRPEGGPPAGAEGRRPEGGPPAAGGPGGGGFPGARGMMQAMQNPEEAFKKMDKNGDGSVTAEEFRDAQSAELDARFKGMDANNDGKITQEEFKGALEKMRGMMRGAMGGGAPGDKGGMRRPGGEGAPGGEGGGFRRPPSQDGDKKPDGAK